MDEIRYLGYILQKNDSDEKHIQDRKNRATIAMKKTWSVGERIFKQDYKRKMKMFGALVESVAPFGAEVWGWNMEGRLDTKKICEMDLRFRYDNTKLYIDRRIQANRNQRKSIKKSSKV